MPHGAYSRRSGPVGSVKEYLATLNDAAFGAATEVEPKFVSPPLDGALVEVMNSRRFMCGWPPPGKRSFGVQRRGRLQSRPRMQTLPP